MNFKNENTMTKKTFTLLFALLLQAAFVLEAKQVSTQEKFDLIAIYAGMENGYTERNPPISGDVASHILTISIQQNVGIAQIMVKDSNGAIVEIDHIMSSPNTSCYYISEAGYYRIDIVLSNGYIYYGYFTVYDGIVI
jgi:hypothetical protein